MLTFTEFRDDTDFDELLYRKLAFNFKAANGFHLVSKEIDTVRQFVRKGKDVQYTSASGILSGFVNVIHSGETVRVQYFRYKTGIHLLTHRQPQGVLLKCCLRNRFFCQRIGVRYDEQRRVVVL
ncbi:hypothetical protein SDC9_74938 [bioreactor metagenome]|uniref:Uncharacterized protein n=1 Tax=bioreactor metagenome TaxID=1076179 RepID=A0A644YIU6_9ZZZZ